MEIFPGNTHIRDVERWKSIYKRKFIFHKLVPIVGSSINNSINLSHELFAVSGENAKINIKIPALTLLI